MPPWLELVFLKAHTAHVFLPEAGHTYTLTTGPYHVSGGQSTPHKKEQNQILSYTVLYSLRFSVPHMYLLYPCLVPKEFKTLVLCLFFVVTLRGGWTLA